MEIQSLDFQDPRWKTFVESFADVNIFHSPEMATVFAASEGFNVLPLFALEDGEPVAAAFAVLVATKYRLLGRFANRLILYASPLYRSTPAGVRGVEQVLQHLEQRARRSALFMEIRNSERFPASGDLAAVQRYEYIPYQNYLVPLHKGADALWTGLGSFTRNHIRKSEKKGAVIREISAAELEPVVQMIEQLYARKKIPVINRTVFFNAYRLLAPAGMIRATVLDTGTTLIGARIVLNYGGTVYDWYAASEPEYSGHYPNEALAWDAMRWGCEHGFRLFDFGGGAIRGQEYGPAKFKEKFKGDLVEFGRYRYAPTPLLYALAKRGYEWRTAR